jgi:hypothetical protein
MSLQESMFYHAFAFGGAGWRQGEHHLKYRREVYRLTKRVIYACIDASKGKESIT